MRILVINRYFGNDEVPTGRMLRDLSSVLLRQGHQVTVMAVHNRRRSVGGIPADLPKFAWLKIRTGGEKSRLVSWFLFWLQACFLTPLISWDRCIILTDPPFLTIIPLINHFLGRGHRQVYWWTMDLYPEAPVAAGLIKEGGLLHRFLIGVNNLGLRHMAGVICLGEVQRRRLSRYRYWQQKPEFSLVIPPWDNRTIAPVPVDRNRFLQKFALDGYRIVLYAGNLGKAHSYSELLQGAKFMDKTNPEWKFIFAVRGPHLVELEREAADLSNVIIVNYQPAELTADLLWAATVHVITMKDGWEGIVVPSKLYGILKTAAPVLFIGPEDSDTAREIKKYRFGEFLNVGASGERVARKLIQLATRNDPVHVPVITGGVGEIGHFITKGS